MGFSDIIILVVIYYFRYQIYLVSQLCDKALVIILLILIRNTFSKHQFMFRDNFVLSNIIKI